MKKEKIMSERERWEIVTLLQVSIILIFGVFTLAIAFRVINVNCEAAIYLIGEMR